MPRMNFLTIRVAWPLAARAQQAERMRRVGVLMAFAEDDPETTARVAGFRQGLERLGWSEGRNVRFDYRFARGGADQFQPLAKELVALQPDVILAQSTPVAAVLQRESRVIPIVFINVSDPIGSHRPADVRGGHRRQMVRAAQGDCARLGRTARADPFCEDLRIRSDRSRSIWRVPDWFSFPFTFQ